jgi:hypothetical protein
VKIDTVSAKLKDLNSGDSTAGKMRHTITMKNRKTNHGSFFAGFNDVAFIIRVFLDWSQLKTDLSCRSPQKTKISMKTR